MSLPHSPCQRRCRARPEARIDALYRAFAPVLVGIVARELRRPRAEVEDGCQEAWAILARRPDVLDGPSPRRWLVIVAIHAYIHAVRGAPIALEVLPDQAAPPLEDLLDARRAAAGRPAAAGAPARVRAPPGRTHLRRDRRRARRHLHERQPPRDRVARRTAGGRLSESTLAAAGLGPTLLVVEPSQGRPAPESRPASPRTGCPRTPAVHGR